jgi:signal transduction histidine kinase
VTQPLAGDVAPPPYALLRERLLELARGIEASGHAVEADSLRATVTSWWQEQQVWDARLAQSLALHHEINNALVGVRGNTQLLLMGPAGQQPGTRERLEVVIRETGRIQEAAGRLRELKFVVGGSGPSSLAA